MALADQVKEVAEQIQARGDKVTVRAVRKIVGGDTSVITRVLREMRSETELNNVSIPESLLLALKTALRAEKQSGAACRAQEIQTAYDELEKAIANSEEAEDKINDLKIENCKIIAQLDQANIELVKARDAARIAQERAASAEEARAELAGALYAQIKILKEELVRAREAERVAQERAAVAESKNKNINIIAR